MNWKDKTIFIGDNLDIMRGMNSDRVDLIYLDPPFNSNQNYAAPIGSPAAGAAFKDTWTLSDVDEAEHGELADRSPALHTVIQASREAHGKTMMAYLVMMSLRPGDAPTPQSYRLNLPSLRSNRLPLPQDGHGFDLWTG